MRMHIIVLLVIAATPAAWGHDDAAPATTQPAETQPALPPLTAEEALSLAAKAKTTYQQELMEISKAFRAQVQEALAKAEGASREAIASLDGQLDKQLTAIRDDLYLPEYAAENDPFEIEALKPARQAYVDQLYKSDDKYVASLRAALARDEQGAIGEQMMKGLATSTDSTLMFLLMDWYWHHQNFDTPPASYERIIQLGYRFVELEPKSPTVYCNTAWLLWSRWVSWKQDAKRMPVGERGDEIAHAFLLKGRAANMDDSTFHFDAGMTFWGLAQHHDRKYYAFIYESMKLSDEHAKDDRTRIRARLTLGHAYRLSGKLDEARAAYKRVLEIDPKHEVTLRVMHDMDHPETVPPVPSAEGKTPATQPAEAGK